MDFKNDCLKYRPDIDGLRALAILIVIGFHFFPFKVRGGFIGVDIFFVISGFLITRIIINDLMNNSFSFYNFYTRRIKRIFPALILVLISCYILGWFFLLPNEYKQLAKHIEAGSIFISNIVLWKESGYFDSAAYTKPLQHLWSLGVEEQFYLVWPLLLNFFYKRNFKLINIIINIALISFLINLWSVRTSPVYAFYSPLPRFWELMAGGMLACKILHTPRSSFSESSILSFTGILLIAFAVLMLKSNSVFPGWWATLPVLGAFLILLSSPHAWLNRIILSNRVMVWFGKISYPLYLWHWALLSFVFINEGQAPHWLTRLEILAISIFLSWVTYRFIERPIRFNLRPNFVISPILIASILTLTFTGYLTYQHQGFLSRFPQSNDLASLLHYDEHASEYGSNFLRQSMCFSTTDKVEFFKKNKCTQVKYANQPVVFLIGDSHSAYLRSALEQMLQPNKINLMQISSGYCLPLSSTDQRPGCADISKLIFETIAQVKPEVVILFGNYYFHGIDPSYGPHYEDFLYNQLLTMKNIGAKKIVFIGQIPTWRSSLAHTLVRNFVIKNKAIPTRTYQGVEEGTLQWDTRMGLRHYPDGIVYASLREALCNTQGCLTQVGNNLSKDLIVWDYGHLTKSGANYVVKTVLAKPLADSGLIK